MVCLIILPGKAIWDKSWAWIRGLERNVSVLTWYWWLIFFGRAGWSLCTKGHIVEIQAKLLSLVLPIEKGTLEPREWRSCVVFRTCKYGPRYYTGRRSSSKICCGKWTPVKQYSKLKACCTVPDYVFLVVSLGKRTDLYFNKEVY